MSRKSTAMSNDELGTPGGYQARVGTGERQRKDSLPKLKNSATEKQSLYAEAE